MVGWLDARTVAPMATKKDRSSAGVKAGHWVERMALS